jgi:hypothetical protein
MYTQLSIQCSIEVQWLISYALFLWDIFLFVNANKIQIREIDKIVYHQICQRI